MFLENFRSHLHTDVKKSFTVHNPKTSFFCRFVLENWLFEFMRKVMGKVITFR